METVRIVPRADFYEGVASCDYCNKPIVEEHALGLYCADRCGFERDKETADKFEGLLNRMLGEML
jgi:ribosomal protein L37AE/L43A